MHAIAAPVINHPCAVCQASTSMWCSRCQSAWYCSPDHLRHDWPSHRNTCTPAAHMSISLMPAPPIAEPELITVSGIFFHPQEEKPQLIQVKCRPSLKPSQGGCPTPLLQQYFPGGSMENLILSHGLNGETLRFPLSIWYCPTSVNSGSSPNRAIQNITGRAARKAWCGPVVALKFNGSRRQGFTAAGGNDLPALSTYFMGYE
ncbi:hypothetical protein BKA70DRAFT_482993 [Coprinopsis sp. MPI-PUGE-AT-0042]|nr:hypothetical protein BKA70DRAFT_482993 [Coprinopsis sp. MPI-PUGE-AT-0042]